MKKNVFVLALLCIVSMMAKAEVAKYCMSYEDFVAGNWKSVDELVAGRSKQAIQIKNGEYCVYFKTGDKTADRVLKKEAFAVMYGSQLYVNCRDLSYKGASLETSKYVPAARYNNNKLCILSHRTEGFTAVASFGASVAGVLVNDRALSLSLVSTSIAFGVANESLSKLACFLVDGEKNDNGKTIVKRINDEYMDNLLADDAALLAKYKAIKSKHNRQSAANVLPILMEKGLIATPSN